MRSTVGFVRNCGILRREHAGRVDEAYAFYRSRRSRTHPQSIEAQLFRRSYSYETRIRFIGVWDTVGALGIPFSRLRLVNLLNRRWQFHDTDLSTTVDAAFQALAIDEKRGPFRPTIWKQQANADGQRLEQVWFAGVHSDIGGGYPDPALAEIALCWMVDRASACGLVFDTDAFAPLPPGEDDSLRHTGRYVLPMRWGSCTSPGRASTDCSHRASETLASPITPTSTSPKARSNDAGGCPPTQRQAWSGTLTAPTG